MHWCTQSEERIHHDVSRRHFLWRMIRLSWHLRDEKAVTECPHSVPLHPQSELLPVPLCESAEANRRKECMLTLHSGTWLVIPICITRHRDTIVTVDESMTEEEVMETLKAHKQIIANVKTQTWPMHRKLKVSTREPDTVTYCRAFSVDINRPFEVSAGVMQTIRRKTIRWQEVWSPTGSCVTPHRVDIKADTGVVISLLSVEIANSFFARQWLYWFYNRCCVACDSLLSFSCRMEAASVGIFVLSREIEWNGSVLCETTLSVCIYALSVFSSDSGPPEGETIPQKARGWTEAE